MDQEEEHEQDRRKRWFDWYVNQLDTNSVHLPAEGGPYNCPCCGCRTLDSRGQYAICPVCYWEDDGQDEQDAHVVRGGPNGALSLAAARENYRRIGASDASRLEHVRPPRPEELP